MGHDPMDQTPVIAGVFTISCFAISFVYGLDAVVAWAIGMLLLSALICALSSGSGQQ